MANPSYSLRQLEHALEAEEFEFWYQPKVSFLTGRVCGCEALLRWRKPGEGIIPPGEFLPLAEKSGFITQITQAMFPKLCVDYRKMQDAFGEFQVAFNISAKDLQSREMVDTILRAVHTGMVSRHQLQVELTETVAATTDPRLREGLDAVVDAGIALAMDDFGTGYSSLDTLHKLPFTIVKIDQGVVMGLMESAKCASIVLASIRMAHEMDLKVVAEGVESEQIFEYLLHAGCTEAQGFWISRPIPLDAFHAFVAADPCWSGMPIGLLHHIGLDHIQWRRSLMERVLATYRKEAARSIDRVELSPYNCRFGRWYYGIGRIFAGDPHFDALEEPHNRLHLLAAQLLKAAGNDADYDELRERGEIFNRCSAEVLQLLQELEIKALLQASRDGMRRPRGTPDPQATTRSEALVLPGQDPRPAA